VRGEREPTDDRHDLQNIFPHTEPSNLLGDWSEEQSRGLEGRRGRERGVRPAKRRRAGRSAPLASEHQLGGIDANEEEIVEESDDGPQWEDDPEEEHKAQLQDDQGVVLDALWVSLSVKSKQVSQPSRLTVNSCFRASPQIADWAS
jgi:hypothetical protein